MGNVFVPATITGADRSCFERRGVVSTRGGREGSVPGPRGPRLWREFPRKFRKADCRLRKITDERGGCNPLNPPWIRLCVIVREKKTSASKNDKEKCTYYKI